MRGLLDSATASTGMISVKTDHLFCTRAPPQNDEYDSSRPDQQRARLRRADNSPTRRRSRPRNPFKTDQEARVVVDRCDWRHQGRRKARPLSRPQGVKARPSGLRRADAHQPAPPSRFHRGPRASALPEIGPVEVQIQRDDEHQRPCPTTHQTLARRWTQLAEVERWRRRKALVRDSFRAEHDEAEADTIAKCTATATIKQQQRAWLRAIWLVGQPIDERSPSESRSAAASRKPARSSASGCIQHAFA